jgi:hypothetical protein
MMNGDPISWKSRRQDSAAGVMRLIPLRTHLMVADALPRAFPVLFLRSTAKLCSAILLFSLVFFTNFFYRYFEWQKENSVFIFKPFFFPVF